MSEEQVRAWVDSDPLTKKGETNPTAHTCPTQPLKAKLRVRALHLEPRQEGGYTLLSDGPTKPQLLIKEEVLDRAFGKGAYEALTQPDHWRMIEEGCFAGDDLYLPSEFDDPQYRIWYANYRPECEAHDLLFDLFRDRVQGMMLSYSVDDLGLKFAEHPCTPRLATVRLVSAEYLPKLIEDVKALTKWTLID